MFTQYIKQSSRFSLVKRVSSLVNKSLRLVSVPSFAILIVQHATASLEQRYQIDMYFFFNVESGCDVFLKTASLSQKTFVGPSKGTPNILSLHCIDSICSTTVFIAMNLLPHVLVSTVFCLLLYQMMGARFTNMSIPVCDLHFTLSAVWSESTKQCVDTYLPHSGGMLLGNLCFAYQ